MRGEGPDVLKIWKERGIENVVVAGIVTSGSVLSSVGQLADLDCGLYVVEDCCWDFRDEVHEFLV
jgi:nicotinamidase-related amidase